MSKKRKLGFLIDLDPQNGMILDVVAVNCMGGIGDSKSVRSILLGGFVSQEGQRTPFAARRAVRT